MVEIVNFRRGFTFGNNISVVSIDIRHRSYLGGLAYFNWRKILIRLLAWQSFVKGVVDCVVAVVVI